MWTAGALVDGEEVRRIGSVGAFEGAPGRVVEAAPLKTRVADSKVQL